MKKSNLWPLNTLSLKQAEAAVVIDHKQLNSTPASLSLLGSSSTAAVTGRPCIVFLIIPRCASVRSGCSKDKITLMCHAAGLHGILNNMDFTQDIPNPSNYTHRVYRESGSVDLKTEMCKFEAVGTQIHGYLHLYFLFHKFKEGVKANFPHLASSCLHKQEGPGTLIQETHCQDTSDMEKHLKH